jgi:hypothetical protein
MVLKIVNNISEDFCYIFEPFVIGVSVDDDQYNVDSSKFTVGLWTSNGVLNGAKIVRTSWSDSVYLVHIMIENESVLHSKDNVRVQIGYDNQSVMSEPFSVVRYRCQLQPHTHRKFFKDKGGKNHFMSLECQVVDKNNQPPPCKIDFTCKLMYSSNKMVDDQSILQYHFIDQGKGIFLLKYRINQVSRAHLNNDFRVQVMAHDDATVAPTITEPVTVLSKINNRSSASHKIAAEYQSSWDAPKSTTKMATTTNNERRVTKRAAPTPMPTTTPPPTPTNTPVSTVAIQPNFVNQSLLQSMYQTLKKIEWQPCGYCTSPIDGSLDYQRKFYKCSACGRYKADSDPSGFDIKPANEHEDTCPIYCDLKEYEKMFGPQKLFQTNLNLEPSTSDTTTTWHGMCKQFNKPKDIDNFNTTNGTIDTETIASGPPLGPPTKIARVASWTKTTRIVKEEFEIDPLNTSLHDRSFEFSGEFILPPRPMSQSFSECSHTSVTITGLNDDLFSATTNPPPVSSS